MVGKRRVKVYVCPRCRIPRLEKGKWRAEFRKGAYRPVLEEVTVSMLKCPRCGNVYYPLHM